MGNVELLQIEPTTRCNYTCGFCAGRYMEQTDLPFERFLAALDEYPGLQHIELQGEGEPLLHPQLLPMMERARERGIKVSFITNGSLLSDAVIERILDLAPEKFYVSMESADPRLFQEIRGGKLEKVLRGLEALMTRRRERGLARPSVGLAVTVMKKTRSELPAIRALYERLGLDGGISVQSLQTMDSYTQHYGEDLRAQLLSSAEKAELFAGAKANPAARSSITGFYDHLLMGFRATRRRCPWLERGLYVNAKGDITACCMIKDTERYALGRLGETPAEEVLAKRDALREELASGKMPVPCRGCTLARFAIMDRREYAQFRLARLRLSRAQGAKEPGSAPARVSLPVISS